MASNRPNTKDCCSASQKMYVGKVDGPWYSTVCPNESYDSNRTHRFPYSCNLQQITGGTGKYSVRSHPLSNFPSPYSVATRNRNELFVYYGTNIPENVRQSEVEAGTATRFGPKVAKICADRFDAKIWDAQLFFTDENHTWNYTGGMGVHGNGNIYVVSSYKIAKIDPDNGCVHTETLPNCGEHPGRRPGDTTYNGFVVLSDGKIVCKSMQRKKGSNLQSANALFNAFDFDVHSVVSVIDPDSLKVLSTALLPQAARGRVSCVKFRGQEYVYLPGAGTEGCPSKARVFRFIYDSEGSTLTLDQKWNDVPYVGDGEQAGTAVALMGDYGVVQSNFSGNQATQPMSITVFCQETGNVLAHVTPFSDLDRIPTPNYEDIISSQFSLPTVDPNTLRIWCFDWGAGYFGGLQFRRSEGGDGDTLTRLWYREQRTNAFAALVGPQDGLNIVLTSQRYEGTDSSCKGQGDSNPTETLIWRCPETGRQLAESAEFVAGIGLPVGVGFNGRFYTLNIEGQVVEHVPVLSN